MSKEINNMSSQKTKFDEKLKKDWIVKNLFTRRSDIIEYIIYNTTNEKVKIKKVFIPETVKRSKKDKVKRMDLLSFADNGALYEFEFNTEDDSDSLHAKNFEYAYTLYKHYIRHKENIADLAEDIKAKKIVQIIFNFRCYVDSENFDKVNTKYTHQNKTYLPNLDIYTIEVENIKKKVYNYDQDEWLSFLVSFDSDEKELKRLSKKFKKVEDIYMELKKLNREFDILAPDDPEYVNALDQKIQYNDGLKDGEKLGMQKGQALGKEEIQKHAVKNMLKDNLEPKTIAKYLGLSVSKVNNIISMI